MLTLFCLFNQTGDNAGGGGGSGNNSGGGDRRGGGGGFNRGGDRNDRGRKFHANAFFLMGFHA